MTKKGNVAQVEFYNIYYIYIYCCGPTSGHKKRAGLVLEEAIRENPRMKLLFVLVLLFLLLFFRHDSDIHRWINREV